MKKKKTNKILKTMYESAMGLYKVGLMNAKTLSEFALLKKEDIKK